MNDKDAEEIAKKILDMDGYENYSITSNIHESGSTFRTIEAQTPELIITLIIEEDTGFTINKSVGKKLVKEVNETVQHTENSVINANLFFGLREPVTVPGNIVNSSDIEIICSQKNSNSIIGFTVKILDLNQDKLEKAYDEVRRLTNFLSIKTGQPIDHNRPEITYLKGKSTTSSKSFSSDALLIKSFDLDLTDSKITNIINDNNPILTQQIADAISGIKAYDDKNYKDAIRNFWMSIENENLQLPKNYKSLRHGLSHTEITSAKVENDLTNDFKLVLKTKTNSTHSPQGIYIDLNNSKNREILREEATFLKDKVIKLLGDKLT